jgi:histone H3/H4
MKHAKRKKLTAEDFNKALRHSDIEVRMTDFQNGANRG